MGGKAQAAGAGSGRLEVSPAAARDSPCYRLRYRASYQVVARNTACHRDRVPRPQGRLCRDAGSAGPSESRNGQVDGDPGAAGAQAMAGVTAAGTAAVLQRSPLRPAGPGNCAIPLNFRRTQSLGCITCRQWPCHGSRDCRQRQARCPTSSPTSSPSAARRQVPEWARGCARLFRRMTH